MKAILATAGPSSILFPLLNEAATNSLHHLLLPKPPLYPLPQYKNFFLLTLPNQRLHPCRVWVVSHTATEPVDLEKYFRKLEDPFLISEAYKYVHAVLALFPVSQESTCSNSS